MGLEKKKSKEKKASSHHHRFCLEIVLGEEDWKKRKTLFHRFSKWRAAKTYQWKKCENILFFFG